MSTPFEERIAYHFKNPQNLALALIHPSRDPSRRAKSFERLEFLGDRVLGLVITEYLYHRFPKGKEGELAKRLAALVCCETCHHIAQALDIQTALSLEEKYLSGSVLADALEALIGSIYIDGGLDAARNFILTHWKPLFKKQAVLPTDSKTALQEWAQDKLKIRPQYEVLNVSGPDHNPLFQVRVTVGKYGSTEATGPSKKHAERAAAKKFLETFCK